MSRKLFATLLSTVDPRGLTWDDCKPIVRCVIASWVGFVLILVPSSLKVLGQASFLVLVVSLANPPNGPVVKVVYDSFYNVLFVCISWAWYVIGARAAVASRAHVYTQASLAIPNLENFLCSSSPSECFSTAIFDGEFIEAGSSIVYSVFLYFGAAAYLYLKVTCPARLLSVIFGLVSLIIPLLYGPLFPYWYPQLGQTVFIPIAVQCAINVVSALVFWPQSMSHAYTKQIQGLLGTIEKLVTMQQKVLQSEPRDPEDWARHGTIKDQVRAARAGLAAFGPNEALLVREVQYGRLNADDLRSLTTGCRDIILKLGGFSLFYDFVTIHMKAWQQKNDAGISTSVRPSEDVEREKEDSDDTNPTPTPGNRTPRTPVTPGSAHDDMTSDSQEQTPNDSEEQLNRVSEKLIQHSAARKDRRKHAHFKTKPVKHKLLHDALHHEYKPVGIFEMHFYVERESRFPRESEVEFLLRMMAIVSDSTKPLFAAVTQAVKADCMFLARTNKDRFINKVLMRRRSEDSLGSLKSARDDLQVAIELFKKSGRLEMLEPYDSLEGHSYGKNPHRPLLRMFYLEFTIIRFAESSLKLTQKCIDFEIDYPEPKWHFPRAIGAWEFRRTMDAGQTQTKDDGEFHEEVDAEYEEDPYQTEVRDPDHGPPRHWYHLLGRGVVYAGRFFKNPSVFFALKAATLIVLIALPAHLRRTAGWFYHQRGLWAVIMASFTQAPFTGDAIFSFIWRGIGTLIGAVCGCVIWYIGDGNGSGQPYGLAATMAVSLIVLVYLRLNWLYINPQPAIFLVLTNSLIVGYSWQDTHLPSAVNLGVGFNVAWRRFVVVLVGATAAFIWSFLPKPTTGRQVIRRRLAGGAFEIGNIYVRVSNFARDPRRTRTEEEGIRQMVVRANAKLLIINLRMRFATFEPPIQGPWPGDKYERILILQREILDLLVAFVNNLTYMDHAWVEPLLRRTGWHDRELVGDCLAVIFMTANAIKTGAALPQIVPSPLIDRFYFRMDRIQETQAEGSLPRIISRETMEDPGYASFAVGSVITFAIINRIDTLLLVTKELVGEVWHTKHFDDGPGYSRLHAV